MCRSSRALLALVMACGCAGGPYRRWASSTSRNVVVYTEARLEHQFIQEWLELSYVAFRAFFPDVSVPTVEAVWLKDQPGSLTRVFRPWDDPRAGWTLARLPRARIGGRGLIVLERAGDARATRDEGIAKRQMAHLWVMQAAPQAPLWLQVGLARYLAGFRIHHQGSSWQACFGSAAFDEPPEINLVPMARSGRRVTIAVDDLFAADWYRYDGRLRDWYEYTAYALVHYLLHGERGWHETRFPLLLQAVRQGRTSEEALALAYPTILHDEWDDRLEAHVRPPMGPARLAAMTEVPQGTCYRVPDAARAADRPRRHPARAEDIQAMLEDLEQVDVFRRHAAWLPEEIVEAEAARGRGRGRGRRPAQPPGRGGEDGAPDHRRDDVPTITAPGAP